MRKFCIAILMLIAVLPTFAQEQPDTIYNPIVNHTSQVARKYTIRGIEITGAPGRCLQPSYEPLQTCGKQLNDARH